MVSCFMGCQYTERSSVIDLWHFCIELPELPHLNCVIYYTDLVSDIKMIFWPKFSNEKAVLIKTMTCPMCIDWYYCSQKSSRLPKLLVTLEEQLILEKMLRPSKYWIFHFPYMFRVSSAQVLMQQLINIEIPFHA